MKEPLETFADPSCTDMTIMAGGQVLKTTVFLVGSAWLMAHSPRPAMFVYPNENLAREVSGTRWMPMLQASPGLQKLVPTRREDWAKLLQVGQNWRANWTGSNSPANLSSRTVGLVISDELEKFAAESKGEASAVRLAELRTKDYGTRGFRASGSTPTVDTSIGWQHYLTGTCEECMWLCPFCGSPMVLDHNDHFVWDGKQSDGTWDIETVKRTAHFVCPHCKKEIWDTDRTKGMRLCYWKPTRVASRVGHRSFWLPSFYSPTVTLGYMASRFLLCYQTGTLRDYYNGDLGKPWEERVLQVKNDSIEALKDNYPTGVCPQRPLFVGVFSDPGQNRTHWAAVAFYEGGTLRVIDYGTVMTIQDVVEIAKTRTWPVATGGRVKATCGLMDSGDFTKDVYDVCYASNLIIPSKGEKEAAGVPFAKSEVKKYDGLPLFRYRDHDAKNDLYERRIAKLAEPRLYIPRDVVVDFTKGLEGQKKIKVSVGRQEKIVWANVKNDHYGDCVKLACVFWWFYLHGLLD
jgi:phage terminase large subunit GpA-like protein